MKTIRFLFKKYLLENKYTQYDVEISRILFYASILYFYLTEYQTHYIPEVLGIYEPQFFHKWLNLPLPGPWITNLETFWLITLVFSCLGFLTNISKALSFTIGFYLLGLSWGFGRVTHVYNLSVICMGILCFSNCGQLLSIDSFLKKLFAKSLVQKNILLRVVKNESWALRLCQLSWSLVFFNAGLSKVLNGGLNIFDPIFLKNMLYNAENFQNPLLFDLMEKTLNYPYLWPCILAFTIIIELGAIVAFFQEGRLKWFIIGSVALMQISAFMFFGINFRKMASGYLFWLPWSILIKKHK